MSYYQENISILCSQYPAFKKDILDKYNKSKDLIISNSKSGLPTARIDKKFIHSNHEPVKEAEKLISSKISAKSAACIIEGFGLGYYVEAVLKLKPGIPVVIVEPSAERFLKSLESRNLSNIFTSPSVSLLVANKSDSIRMLLPGLPKGNIELIKNRALCELDYEYYKEIDRIVHHFVSRKEVNTATLKKFGKLWVRNLINNLNELPLANDVGNLTGLFGNFPVLLLAAGPSLDNVLPLMEELQKGHRVTGKKLPGAPHEVWLVLDATTGQNGISQAEVFNEALGVTGIVLTKVDGTAKGGIVIGISHQLGIPINYVGIGEKVDDLRPFSHSEFVKAIFD